MLLTDLLFLFVPACILGNLQSRDGVKRTSIKKVKAEAMETKRPQTEPSPGQDVRVADYPAAPRRRGRRRRPGCPAAARRPRRPHPSPPDRATPPSPPLGRPHPLRHPPRPPDPHRLRSPRQRIRRCSPVTTSRRPEPHRMLWQRQRIVRCSNFHTLLKL